MSPEAQEAQQAPKGPETLGDPTLIEADEALKAANSLESTESNTLRIQHLNSVLSRVEARISIVKETEPSNYEKLRQLSDRQLKLTQKRDELIKKADVKADAAMAEVGADMKAYGDQLEANVKRMEELRAEKAKLETELKVIESSTEPKDIQRREEIYGLLEANSQEMTSLEAQGKQEDQAARFEVAHQIERKAHAMVEAEHDEQAKAADKLLSEYTEESEDKKTEGEKRPEEDKPQAFTDADWDNIVQSLEEEATLQGLKDIVSKYAPDTKDAQELKTKAFVEALEKAGMKSTDKFKDFLKDEKNREKAMTILNTPKEKGPGVDKKKIFNNFIHQSCSDLASEMARSVPEKEDTIGWTFFEVKRMGLMIASAFAGNAWVENLSADEQSKLAMEVTQVKDDKGKTKYKVKWNKLEHSNTTAKEVYEKAFGEDDWAEQMKGLTPDTTLKDLQDKVATFPADATDAKQLKMKAFVEAVAASGATPETKLQAYLNDSTNAEKVKSQLIKPASADSAASPETTEGEELGAEALVKVIDANKFNEKTTLAEYFNKIEGGGVIGDIDPAKLASLTPESLEKITIKPEITKEALDELYAANQLKGKQEIEKSLGIKSAEFPEGLYKKASEEIASGKLSESTVEELNAVVRSMIEVSRELFNTTLKTYLEKSITDPKDKETLDTVLAALKKNNPPE